MANKAARLAEIYAQIPSIPGCTGYCWRSCGPIDQLGLMTPYEHTRLRDAPRIENAEPSDCTLLTPDRRCSVYERRPFICRLWGTVPSMRCPRGCVPERWLTDEEGAALHKQVIALSGAEQFAYGDATRAALAALGKVWRERNAL